MISTYKSVCGALQYLFLKGKLKDKKEVDLFFYTDEEAIQKYIEEESNENN